MRGAGIGRGIFRKDRHMPVAKDLTKCPYDQRSDGAGRRMRRKGRLCGEASEGVLSCSFQQQKAIEF